MNENERAEEKLPEVTLSDLSSDEEVYHTPETLEEKEEATENFRIAQLGRNLVLHNLR